MIPVGLPCACWQWNVNCGLSDCCDDGEDPCWSADFCFCLEDGAAGPGPPPPPPSAGRGLLGFLLPKMDDMVKKRGLGRRGRERGEI